MFWNDVKTLVLLPVAKGRPGLVDSWLENVKAIQRCSHDRVRNIWAPPELLYVVLALVQEDQLIRDLVICFLIHLSCVSIFHTEVPDAEPIVITAHRQSPLVVWLPAQAGDGTLVPLYKGDWILLWIPDVKNLEAAIIKSDCEQSWLHWVPSDYISVTVLGYLHLLHKSSLLVFSKVNKVDESVASARSDSIFIVRAELDVF